MDKYKVIKFLNNGSYGKIYIIEHRNTHEKYAMKTIKIDGISRYQKQNILTELKILLTNTCEYMLKCYDLFICKHRICIVTEYIDGGDLAQFIKNNKTIKIEKIIEIFWKICKGINSMHKNNILHRDIKPANILITKNGEIKICDFGICKYIHNNCADTIIGTPYFMSPEQVNHKKYDFKSDVWSIGCVLYCLLYGKHPFRGNSMNELNNNIQVKNPFIGLSKTQVALNDILKAMLNKNKSLRPNLNTLLSNNNKLDLRNIRYRKCFHLNIPFTETDWTILIKKLQSDFDLPKILLHNRTAEILKTKQNDNLPRLLPPPLPYKRSPPPLINSHYRHRYTPPIPLYQARLCNPQQARLRSPPQANLCSPPQAHLRSPPQARLRSPPQFRSPSPALNYLCNKEHSPKLPNIKNRYKNVQSKVKHYWK